MRPLRPPRSFLVLAVGLTAAVALLGCLPSSRVEKPNVLVIMTDDQGWGDVRVHGNALIDTPNMDRLADEGATFDRFYVSPVCAPTRASLLTGRYHLRTGTQWVTHGLETMRPDEVTMAEVFRAAGYATGIFGKWHNGSHYPADPIGQGFDTFVGFSAGHWNNYFNTSLQSGNQLIRTEGYITDVLTDSLLSFIDRHQGRPFFAYVPYNAPHSPFQVPDAYFDKYKARGLDDRTASVYGMVENVDDNLDRILSSLSDKGLEESTIVVFLTDNGPNGQRFNGDMRGTKASLHEGGSRVPLFVRWSGHIDPTTEVHEIAAHVDLLPTLVELTGVPTPEGPPMDGLSLAQRLLGNDQVIPERALFNHHSFGPDLDPRTGAVRTDRWRLVFSEAGWQLFDTRADPGEENNVAAAFTHIADTLTSLYEAWATDVTKGLPVERRIPVGYSEAPHVALPAVESQFEGGLEFAGGMGWANDWLIHWSAPGDRATWKLDVIEPGRYRVAIDYAASRPGARLVARVEDRHVEAEVAYAHDPPTIPSPDRLLRGEVYEKEWAQIELGVLELEHGARDLVVELLDSPGDRALELHTVHLDRIDPL